MRILFLNSARRWGGNEKWTRMAAENLAKNHPVYLAYRNDDVGSKFQISQFKLPFQFEGDLITIFKLYHFVRKNNIQILVPTKPKEYVLAGIVSKLLHRQNIGRLGIVRKMNRPLLHRLVYGYFLDGIIVNADEIKETLLESQFIDPTKIRRIYNGLNQDEIKKKSKDLIAEKPFKWMAVTAGELSPRKNVELLLKSFAAFIHQKNIKDAGLWIVGGKGPYLEHLKQLAFDLKIHRYVVFIGYVDNPYPYLKQSNVFVSCSLNEGISNALLEAMALNTVVITTDAGGTKEMLIHNKNGLLFAMNDDAALAKQLYDLYQHPQKVAEIAKAAEQTIEDQFSIARMTNEIEDYFQEVIR